MLNSVKSTFALTREAVFSFVAVKIDAISLSKAGIGLDMVT